MDNIQQFIWILLREKVIYIIDNNPDELDDLSDVLDFLQNFAASESLEDYELADKIKKYKESKINYDKTR